MSTLYKLPEPTEQQIETAKAKIRFLRISLASSSLKYSDFYSSVLLNFELDISPTVPMAGISTSKLYFNQLFVLGLSQEQKKEWLQQVNDLLVDK